MDSRLAFAAELEQRDATLAGRIGALAELSAEVELIRARAAEIESLLEALPAERAHLDEADADAARDRELARAGLAEAESALERARSEDARDTARRAVMLAAAAVRAEDERRVRLIERRTALEQEAERLEAEAGDLERRAAAAAASLEKSSRVSSIAPPERGLSGIVDWGARAHAAVVVARGGLESERERIVREANELAASVLGEPLYTASVALVRRRLETELA
jgi:DNA repair exonuclease SbcCD ATPase subunit